MNIERLVAAALVAVAAGIGGCGDEAPGGGEAPPAAVAAPKALAHGAPVNREDGSGAAGEGSGVQPETPPASAQPSDVPAEVESEVDKLPALVARVEGREITGQEFGLELDFSLKRMRLLGMPLTLKDDQRAELLENVIDGKVLALLAERAGVTVTDEAVRAEFDSRKAKLPSEEYYRQHLEYTQRTEEELFEALRVRMAKEEFVEANTQGLAATDEEVAEEYERLKATGEMDRIEETVDFSHILIRVAGAEEEAWSKAKERIEAARARVAAGEDFGDVARAVSEDLATAERGGLYPEARRRAIPPEIAEYVFAAPLDEVSEPFRSRMGWHIATVSARHEPGTMALEDVQTPLRKVVLDYKRRKAVKRLVDEAKRSMAIERFYPVDEADDPVPATAATASGGDAADAPPQ